MQKLEKIIDDLCSDVVRCRDIRELAMRKEITKLRIIDWVYDMLPKTNHRWIGLIREKLKKEIKQ